MTQITFQDGKPVMRDGKIGTGSRCCCGGNPACCQHYCNKMCCPYVEFVVPGQPNYVNAIGADCRALLAAPEIAVRIRVRVRCNGYNAELDCDTDCEIVEAEYSEDEGVTWTAERPDAAAGITWSIFCEGAPQPESQYGAARCAGLTPLNAEQCEAADGEPCNRSSQSQPCPPCGLVCPPGPSEWRLIRDGVVWFAGDVIENPDYQGDIACTDPCEGDAGIGPRPPRLLMENFPDLWPVFHDVCPYPGPAGWPVPVDSEGAYLVLQVLGCNGDNWQSPDIWCDCYTPDWQQYFGFPGTTLSWLCGDNCMKLGICGSAGDLWLQSPPGCACLRDPTTGAMVLIPDTPGCCRTCNNRLGVILCGTGLEYLDHGEAVRFTGAVDNEGSNLWNWQDAKGRSPAGSWPSPNADIVIAGELRSWRPGGEGYLSGFHPSYPSSLHSITLEPGAVLAINMTTETLTVDAATIEAAPLDLCVNGGLSQPGAGEKVAVTVTGTATFLNGAENRATGMLDDPFVAPFPGITGNCVFETGSQNFGTIAGNCTFSGDAVNNGTITGDATFSGNAVNAGTVTGNCTFSGSAMNTGTVDGNATFTGTSRMDGDVTGTATFADDACWASGTAGTFVPNQPPEC